MMISWLEMIVSLLEMIVSCHNTTQFCMFMVLEAKVELNLLLLDFARRRMSSTMTNLLLLFNKMQLINYF